MSTQTRIALILSLCLSSWLQAAEFHTFKDTQGREMEAQITRVRGDTVYIERKDGLKSEVSSSVFCKEDQAYIAEWAKNAVLEGDVLKLEFSEKKSDKQKTSGTIKREEYNSNTAVVLKNTAGADLSDIRVEYLILKFADVIAAEKRSEGDIERFKGQSNVKLLRKGAEVRVETQPIPMLETKLAGGYTYGDGRKDSSKDKIEGIWVKIYVGDKLVHEESKPEHMREKEAWK